MYPIRRSPSKQQLKGMKGTRTKYRSYRTEEQTYQKKPENVVGTDIKIYRLDISKEKRTDKTGSRHYGSHTTYHIERDVIWALGPKAKHETMRGQWGKISWMTVYKNF